MVRKLQLATYQKYGKTGSRLILGGDQVEYKKAKLEESQIIADITKKAIEETYPLYYPKEVVKFFVQLHSLENIKEDISEGNVGILMDEGQIVGTGAYKENHITRVYVLPEKQGKGYGTYIMDELERAISKHYTKAELDASLPASRFYEHRGYNTRSHGEKECENHVILVYEIMEKALKGIRSFTYNGRKFITKYNSINGKQSAATLFHYHQEANMVWAEYSGGEVKQGILVGAIHQDYSLDFKYQHITIENEIRISECHSIPHINEAHQLEMIEEWQWLNGDFSKGTSIVIEC